MLAKTYIANIKSFTIMFAHRICVPFATDFVRGVFSLKLA